MNPFISRLEDRLAHIGDVAIGTAKGTTLGVGFAVSPQISSGLFLKDIRKHNIPEVMANWEVGSYLSTATLSIGALIYDLNWLYDRGREKDILLYGTAWIALQSITYGIKKYKQK